MKLQLMRWGVAVLVLQGTVGAQAKPDFTGTWEMDVTQSESTAQAVPIPPSTVIIAQTPSAFRIETRSGGSIAVQTFSLENVELPPDKTSESSHTFSWDGDTLVTTASETHNEQAITRTKRQTMDSTGKTMTVDTTLMVHHAYSTTKSTDVFRRTKD